MIGRKLFVALALDIYGEHGLGKSEQIELIAQKYRNEMKQQTLDVETNSKILRDRRMKTGLNLQGQKIDCGVVKVEVSCRQRTTVLHYQGKKMIGGFVTQEEHVHFHHIHDLDASGHTCLVPCNANEHHYD